MSTMYRARLGFFKAEIVPVEVERESEKFVFFPGGRRAAKSSDLDSYHQTWEEAHNRLMRLAAAHAHAASESLNRTQEKFAEVAAMQRPKDAA